MTLIAETGLQTESIIGDARNRIVQRMEEIEKGLRVNFDLRGLPKGFSVLLRDPETGIIFSHALFKTTTERGEVDFIAQSIPAPLKKDYDVYDRVEMIAEGRLDRWLILDESMAVSLSENVQQTLADGRLLVKTDKGQLYVLIEERFKALSQIPVSVLR